MPARVRFIVKRAVCMPEVKGRKFKKYAPEGLRGWAGVSKRCNTLLSNSLRLFVVCWIGTATPVSGRDSRGTCGSQAT